VVYSEGNSVDLGMPVASGSRCTGALVAAPILPTVVAGADEVQVLTLLPATSTEVAWCRVHGGDALRERWRSQAIDLLDLGRVSARLDEPGDMTSTGSDT
ncbi:MAG TPA: suppressor of fused domain protein, partial [Mycobacterium sp.]|nr:suppressor of fused domain protein [Mycobacterium sp.]